MWFTKSNQYEIECEENDLDNKMPAKPLPLPNPPDNKEKKREEETTADNVFGNVNNEETRNKLVFNTKIKTQDDDENSDIKNTQIVE